CQSARIPFDNKEAHSALYDTERTTELFCHIVNRWKSMGGWPPAHPDDNTPETPADHEGQE
ncbi:MAG: ribonuclease T, partial [Aeromonas sp.]